VYDWNRRMLKRFWAIFVARNREFLRDRQALGWSLLMPVLLVFGFSYAFNNSDEKLYQIGVYPADAPHTLGLFAVAHLDFVPVSSLETATTQVARHQLDMLLDVTSQRYWINEQSARGSILEHLLHGSDGTALRRESVSGQEIRYVDWVLPGILAMNMTFSALFGVGYVLVRYRKNGVLKRLQATPLGVFEFLVAQIVSRLWLILLMGSLVYAGTYGFLHFKMYGSYLTLLLFFALGSVSMISLGLVLAARLRNEELASGLVDLIGWPMIFLSGVWFSLDNAHPVLQTIAQFLPLTHVVAGARAIMLDNAGLVELLPHIAVLIAMSVVFLIIGILNFLWE